MLVPRDDDGLDDVPDNDVVVINITVTLDEDTIHKSMHVTEVLARACMGLALDGVETYMNICKPVQYIVEVEGPE